MTVFTKRLRRASGAALIGALLSGGVSAQDFPDVTAISLEDLMNLKVTSVSKREQKLGGAAAAIFVITQEDIRRSGAATSRMRCASRPASTWPGRREQVGDQRRAGSTAACQQAAGADRRPERLHAAVLRRLLGRAGRAPRDVERIEVIRGPGATLWGANAVNGVINIITKPSPRPRAATSSGGRAMRCGAGRRALRRQARRQRHLSRLFQVLQVGLLDRRRRPRRVRRLGHRADRISSRRRLRLGDALTLQGDIYAAATAKRSPASC